MVEFEIKKKTLKISVIYLNLLFNYVKKLIKNHNKI